MFHSPLEQFTIFNLPIFHTNMGFYLLLSFAILYWFLSPIKSTTPQTQFSTLTQPKSKPRKPRTPQPVETQPVETPQPVELPQPESPQPKEKPKKVEDYPNPNPNPNPNPKPIEEPKPKKPRKPRTPKPKKDEDSIRLYHTSALPQPITPNFLIYDHLNILAYEITFDLAQQMTGKKTEPYSSYIYTNLLSIVTQNLLGNLPYSFAITAHLTSTLGESFSLLSSYTLIGLLKWDLQFFSLFLPQGTPLPLSPLLALIETISYLARAFSLGIRLAANIMAGHSLLHIILGFFIQKLSLHPLSLTLHSFPFLAILSLFIMELVISLLQAYVYTLLSLSYLTNVLHLA